MSTDVRFFVGIDWASETHQVCLVAADGKIIGERAFAHGGAGLAEMCDWLVTTSGEEPPKIAVAIEVPHGPIVEILLERRFQVDAVNPKQLDRFRDRFTVAGAKDDRRDAYVLGDALRIDRHCFRRLAVEDPVVIELREWSRMAEDLSQERNRLANRVREQLWRYYPQALELGDDLAADWFLALWVLAPTPAKAVRLRESRVTSLLRAHRIRRLEAAEVLRILRQKPLVVVSGTIEAATAHITAVAAPSRLAHAGEAVAKIIAARSVRLAPVNDAAGKRASASTRCDRGCRRPSGNGASLPRSRTPRTQRELRWKRVNHRAAAPPIGSSCCRLRPCLKPNPPHAEHAEPTGVPSRAARREVTPKGAQPEHQQLQRVGNDRSDTPQAGSRSSGGNLVTMTTGGVNKALCPPTERTLLGVEAILLP